MTVAIPKMLRLLPLIVLLAVLVLAACSGGDNSSNITLPSTTEGTDTTEVPDTTQAPEPTDAPETTAGPTTTAAGAATATPEDGESDTDLTLVFIVGGILLIILIVALVAGRSSQETTITSAPPQQPPPASPWAVAARTAYANTRWCADHVTEQLAFWRGDMMVDGDQSATDATAATNAETWSQLGGRMSAATNSLFALEGAVPAASQPIVRGVVDALNNVRSAADTVAKSQVDVRHLEAQLLGADDAYRRTQLAGAEADRRQAVDDLNAKRQALDTALSSLNALSTAPGPTAT